MNIKDLNRLMLSFLPSAETSLSFTASLCGCLDMRDVVRLHCVSVEALPGPLSFTDLCLWFLTLTEGSGTHGPK